MSARARIDRLFEEDAPRTPVAGGFIRLSQDLSAGARFVALSDGPPRAFKTAREAYQSVAGRPHVVLEIRRITSGHYPVEAGVPELTLDSPLAK